MPADPHHYLDDPFVLDILALEEIRDRLRLLAHPQHTALPLRLRNDCAKLHRDVSALLRELRHHPRVLLQERARDEGAPPLLEGTGL
jgi:hypothetical protein